MKNEDLERLLADHRRIRAAGDALATAASAAPPVAHERLAEVRWAFARELLQHMSADERIVHGPIAASSSPHARACEARFRAEGEAFAADFQSHVAKWPTERVGSDWPAYGASVRGMIERLHRRLDDEEREFYPLALVLAGEPVSVPKRNWAGKAWEVREHVLSTRSVDTRR